MVTIKDYTVATTLLEAGKFTQSPFKAERGQAINYRFLQLVRMATGNWFLIKLEGDTGGELVQLERDSRAAFDYALNELRQMPDDTMVQTGSWVGQSKAEYLAEFDLPERDADTQTVG